MYNLPLFIKEIIIYIYIYRFFKFLQQQQIIRGSKENIVNILDNKYYSVFQCMVDFM